MRGASRSISFAILAACGTSLAACTTAFEPDVTAGVPFRVIAVDASVGPQKLSPGDVFLVRQVEVPGAAKLVTSFQTTTLGLGIPLELEPGELLLRFAAEPGADWYCGRDSDSPEQRKQMVCFQDTTGDGIFDLFGQAVTQNDADLPVIEGIYPKGATNARYELLPRDQWPVFEFGVEYQGTANLRDALNFKTVARLASQPEWRGLGSDNKFYANILESPAAVKQPYANFDVVSRSGDAIEVSWSTQHQQMGLLSVKRVTRTYYY
jgi:hypothetical protein